MKRMLKNKKGSVFDILLGMVVLMVAGSFMLVLINVWGDIRDSGIQESLPAGGGVVNDFDQFAVWTWEFGLIMMMIGFYGGAVILAAFARHHPLLAWVNILILIILILVSVPLSNGYEELVSNSALSEEAARLDVFNFLMTNLTLLTIIFAAFLILAMFAFKSEVSAI